MADHIPPLLDEIMGVHDDEGRLADGGDGRDSESGFPCAARCYDVALNTTTHRGHSLSLIRSELPVELEGHRIEYAAPVVKRYVTFHKMLPERAEQVMADLPRKARAAARQARERHGLRAEFDDGHLDTVWSLYSRSMRRLGSLNYPSAFFEALVRRCGGKQGGLYEPIHHQVQLVFYKDEPIAGLVSFICN